MANHDATSSNFIYQYDVFLSFEDETRYGFTGHLYHALDKSGIRAFMTEGRMKRDEISHADVEAIENSRMSIIVLSENYASSTWCLDELLKIFQCYDNKGQQVLAIFYKVEPSDVWEQEAMIKDEEGLLQDSEKIKAWRSTLSRVCELEKEHCGNNRYESELIKKIVKDTWTKLPSVCLEDDEYIVGVASRFEHVKSLMDVDPNNTVCILEIYGANGIGKTTFAKELYNKFKHEFEASCFLNVREISNNNIEGLEELQMKILDEIDKEIEHKIGSTFKGGSQIKFQLRRKRVLLVLDDVDSIKQLEALAGGGDWFGSGSKIIITTSDTSVLDKHEMKNVIIKKYEMEKLNNDDSLELFCWHAFNSSKPEKTFESICSRAINYAKGLPLALKAIGSNLKGKNIEEWEKELEEYEIEGYG